MQFSKKLMTIVLVFCLLISGIVPSFAGETYLECRRCLYKEVLSRGFILKIIGGAVSGSGFWAWVTYFFAGTGLAMPICIALVAGGTAICAYSSEIGEWLSKKYDCPSCGSRDWRVIEY